MEFFEKLNKEIPAPDEAVRAASKERWDNVAKPLEGLGQLEKLITKIAALTGELEPELLDRRVVVFCADNGVVKEGVTQADASVTAVMAGMIRNKRSSVCRMAAAAYAEVFCVDMGMLRRMPGVDGPHIADGTKDICEEPAMTEEECLEAIRYGIDLAGKLKNDGAQILVTGEMGIGNTTTSSALASVLLSMPVEKVTGRGAGLSDAGLCRKREVIRRAVEVNRPDPADAFDVLRKLGGFDICGMTGLFLGGALYKIPVVIDGLISSVAALVAARLCPASVSCMIPSHSSAEPAAEAILKELGLKALIYGELKLGEGTGAVCMLPLLNLALSVYQSAADFRQIGIGVYKPLGGEEA